MVFLLCSRSGLSVSSLVTQKPAGAAALPPGALPPVQPAHVYDRLPQALSLERDANGRAAPGVIMPKWAPGLTPGRGVGAWGAGRTHVKSAVTSAA